MPKKTFTVRYGTPAVRINYPNFVTPRAATEGATKKYSCVIMVPKTSKEIVKAIKAKMKEVYDNNPTILGDYDFDSLVRIYDGAKSSPNGKKYPDYYKDYYIINANNSRKPQYLDKQGAEILDIDEELYSGVWARVGLTFYPYASAGNTGIGISLDIVKKARDDEHLGSVVTEKDYFSDDDDLDDEDDI